MRIVREAMTNAIRHGRATAVTIVLARDNGVRLMLEDDGSGLAAGQPDGRGFGLTSMRERAEALGGTVEVSGGEGGARVEVWLP